MSEDDLSHDKRLLGRIGLIIYRCCDPTCAGWKDYGGRGIKVHEPWITDKGSFLAYLKTLDGWTDPELTIDRTENSLGYEPGNLRFATRSLQNRNKRKHYNVGMRVGWEIVFIADDRIFCITRCLACNTERETRLFGFGETRCLVCRPLELSPEQCLEVRRLYMQGRSRKRLATKFHVPLYKIAEILRS